MRIINFTFGGFSTWVIFLYFSTALNLGLKSLSAKVLVTLKTDVFRFLIALEKRKFKNSAFFSSYVVIFSFSTKVLFSFVLVLSENKVLTVF